MGIKTKRSIIDWYYDHNYKQIKSVVERLIMQNIINVHDNRFCVDSIEMGQWWW